MPPEPKVKPEKPPVPDDNGYTGPACVQHNVPPININIKIPKPSKQRYS